MRLESVRTFRFPLIMIVPSYHCTLTPAIFCILLSLVTGLRCPMTVHELSRFLLFSNLSGTWAFKSTRRLISLDSLEYLFKPYLFVEGYEGI